MKRIFIILLLSFIGIESFSQTDSLKTISLDVVISVINQTKVKNDLQSFWDEHKIVPELFSELNSQFTSNFILTEQSYFVFVDKIESWGVIEARKISSVNYTEKLEDVYREISRLEQEKEEYSNLLNQVDVKSENHVKYWEKLEEIKTALRKQNRISNEYLGSNKKFKIKLEVVENSFLSNEPDFSFVNMPGIQYSYFIPVNSEAGNYPESMNGYAIKYLINRQKTYLELALFKSSQNVETNKYDELYKFGFGKDFYSSHLGRGTREFLNLYSGFNLGVLILTGNEDNLISWYATPSIGLEIYKSKNFIFDTKVGYFLPFKENRNMRGLLLDASLNIVF